MAVNSGLGVSSICANLNDRQFSVLVDTEAAGNFIRKTLLPNVSKKWFFLAFLVDEDTDLLYKLNSNVARKLVVPWPAIKDMIYLFHEHPETGHSVRDETERALMKNSHGTVWAKM